MWIRFSRYSPNWRVVKNFLLAKSENNWPNIIEIVSKRKKILARLASGYVSLLANLEFYSQLASWRVVIRTPGIISSMYCLFTSVILDTKKNNNKQTNKQEKKLQQLIIG
jgi:hypothetical protein